jgi:acyl-CoA thioester hydrolase
MGCASTLMVASCVAVEGLSASSSNTNQTTLDGTIFAMDQRSRHSHIIHVTQAEIDGLGHVNNTVYLRYVEDCVTTHAERVGMGLEQLRALGMLPVVHKHTITYHRSALFGDALEVSTQITHFQGFRAIRHNEVRRDGVLLAECETEWIWIDAVRLRPKAVPRVILEAFGLV